MIRLIKNSNYIKNISKEALINLVILNIRININ